MPSDTTHSKPAWFELRVGAIFAAVFITMGVHLPYFPLWLDTLGFAAGEIAVILAAPMFLRVATTPLVTALADRIGERAWVLIAVTAAALLVSLAYFLPQAYLLTLVASLAFAVFLAPQVPLSDALAVSGVRRFGSDYARMRVWGSVSFLLVNLVCGWAIARNGAGVVPAMLTFGLAATLVIALAAPRLGRPRQPSTPSVAALPRAGMLSNRPFMAMMLGYGLVTGSHGFLYAFVSIYWQALGINGTTVGMLWAVSVVSEVILFAVFRPIFGRVRSSTILAMGAGAATLRWLLFPLIEPVGGGLSAFFVIQCLHGFSFGMTLLGLQKRVAESVPEDRAGGAQGLAYFVSGLSMAAVTLGSGVLYARFGVGGFVAMALLTLAALALIIVARAQPQSSGDGGETREPS